MPKQSVLKFNATSQNKTRLTLFWKFLSPQRKKPPSVYFVLNVKCLWEVDKILYINNQFEMPCCFCFFLFFCCCHYFQFHFRLFRKHRLINSTRCWSLLLLWSQFKSIIESLYRFLNGKTQHKLQNRAKNLLICHQQLILHMETSSRKDVMTKWWHALRNASGRFKYKRGILKAGQSFVNFDRSRLSDDLVSYRLYYHLDRKYSCFCVFKNTAHTWFSCWQAV